MGGSDITVAVVSIGAAVYLTVVLVELGYKIWKRWMR